jgi:hypothetical protein
MTAIMSKVDAEFYINTFILRNIFKLSQVYCFFLLCVIAMEQRGIKSCVAITEGT